MPAKPVHCGSNALAAATTALRRVVAALAAESGAWFIKRRTSFLRRAGVASGRGKKCCRSLLQRYPATFLRSMSGEQPYAKCRR